MKHIKLILALLVILLPYGAEAKVSAGNAYTCLIRDASGKPVANLDISIHLTVEMPDGDLYNASETPLWVSAKSDAADVPSIEMPTSEQRLHSGNFVVSVYSDRAGGHPALRARSMVRLTLDGDAPTNGGYVVIYKEYSGTHFEVAGIGPQMIGLCAMVQI